MDLWLLKATGTVMGFFFAPKLFLDTSQYAGQLLWTSLL